MDWLRSFLLPIQGSAFAGEVDSLFWFITGMAVFFFTGIAIFVAYSMWKYRYKPGVKTPHIADHFGLEMTWTIVPTILCMVVFFWGFQGYISGTIPPANSLEIQVTAKKWVWSFEYPDGTRSINEIHVPVNRPIKMVMTSEDVHPRFLRPDNARQARRGSRPLYTALVHADSNSASTWSSARNIAAKATPTWPRRFRSIPKRNTRTGSKPAATKARTCR